MPPRRSVKRKANGRKAGSGLAAAKDFFVRQDQSQHSEKGIEPIDIALLVEKTIREMEFKVDKECQHIRSKQAQILDDLEMEKYRAKSSIPKAFRCMKLKEYCEKNGEDFGEVLCASLPAKERAALREEVGPEEDEEQDENDDPGTTIKGSQPREVQTPAGNRKCARVTRSALKSRAGNAAAPLPPSATPSTFRKGALSTARTATRASARKTKIQGGEPLSLPGSVLRTLPKADGGAAEDNSDGDALPPRALALLLKRVDPERTVYDHLDSIVQSRIDSVPRKMEERCRQYRQNFDEAVVILRAKIPPREVPGAGGAAGGVTGDGVATEAPPVAESTKKEPEEVERVEEEEEEEEILAAAAAKIKLTAEGGPYNGSVFELYLENDGEPCMLGRSTGKKFKLRGVSLKKDSEVSISHGKFENSEGKVTFADVGSTNGTEVDGEPADPAAAYVMTTGCKLAIGQSVFTVHITWDR